MKALILEAVNAWRHYIKRVLVTVSPDRPGAHRSRAEAIFTVNSGDLSMWFLITKEWLGRLVVPPQIPSACFVFLLILFLKGKKFQMERLL